MFLRLEVAQFDGLLDGGLVRSFLTVLGALLDPAVVRGADFPGYLVAEGHVQGLEVVARCHRRRIALRLEKCLADYIRLARGWTCQNQTRTGTLDFAKRGTTVNQGKRGSPPLEKKLCVVKLHPVI